MYRFLPRSIVRSLTRPFVQARIFSQVLNSTSSLLHGRLVPNPVILRALSLHHHKVQGPTYNASLLNCSVEEKNAKKKRKKNKVSWKAKPRPLNIMDLTNIMMANNLASKVNVAPQKKKLKKVVHFLKVDQKPHKNTKGIIKQLPKTKDIGQFSSDCLTLFAKKFPRKRTFAKSDVKSMETKPELEVFEDDRGRNRLNSNGKLIYADLGATHQLIFNMKFGKHLMPTKNVQLKKKKKIAVTTMPKKVEQVSEKVLSSKIIRPKKQAKTGRKSVERKLKLLNSDGRSKSSKENFVLAFVSPEESESKEV